MDLTKFVQDKFKNNDDYKTALAGTGVFSPFSGFFSVIDRDTTYGRLSGYKEYWNAYLGRHFTSDEEDQTPINHCRKVVHMSCDWLFGKPWSLIAVPGNEAIAEAVQEVWAANDQDLLCYLNAHAGSITGDAYLNVGIESESGDVENGEIVINWLQAQQVNPVFDPITRKKLLGVLIQYNVGTVLNKDGSIAASSALLESAVSQVSIYSQYITATRFVEMLDDIIIRDEPNVLGFIPTIHAQNCPSSASWMGESDLCDAWPLNRQIDRVFANIQTTINYHADPVIAITGAKADQLQKSAGKVWTIPNPEAKIQVIESKGLMGGAAEHLKKLEEYMAMLADTPDSASGKPTNLNGAKAAAVELSLLPIIQKTGRKRLTYGKQILAVSEKIAMMLVAQNPALLKSARNQEKAFKFGIRFGDPVPRDEREQLQNTIMKLQNKITSRAEAIRSTCGADEYGNRVLEVVADQFADASAEFDRTLSMAGQKPSLLHPLAGSLGMALENRVFEKAASAIMAEEDNMEIQPE